MELAIERNRTQKNVPIEQNRTFAFRTQSNERVRLKLVIERSGTHKRKMRIEQNRMFDSLRSSKEVELTKGKCKSNKIERWIFKRRVRKLIQRYSGLLARVPSTVIHV